MKNFLFIGLGSIGQRHLRNLKKINKNFKFFAIRKKKNSPLLDLNNEVVKKKFIAKENNVKEIKLKDLKNYKIDIVFITNPSSKHLNTAITFANLGYNLFIEKPLSHNLKNLAKLRNIINKKKLKCAVGYQTRYDDLFKIIKKIIETKKYGNIKSVNIENRHYLPYHHRYEDYRFGYAARKDLGGGVVLCFIHEIDYAIDLFGDPKEISGQVLKKSSLKINVDDYAEFKIIFNKNKINFPVNFKLDFIKKKAQRFCNIKFQKASIYWDLLSKQLIIKNNKRKIIFKSKFKNRNDLFLFQLKQIIQSIKNKKQPISNFENGEKSLKIAINIKKLFKF